MLSPAAASAQAIWSDGTITRAPWQDRYIHVAIDDVSYTFLNEDIRIAQQYEVKPGMYHERSLTVSDLAVGLPVIIRAQGHRIYEILVSEGH
jgi:hypothetical protein